MVKAVMTASDRDPIIMGKPEQPMIDAIRAMYVMLVAIWRYIYTCFKPHLDMDLHLTPPAF